MSSGLSTEIRVLLSKLKSSRLECRVDMKTYPKLVEEFKASPSCSVVGEQQISVNMAAFRHFEMLIRATDMMCYRSVMKMQQYDPSTNQEWM